MELILIFLLWLALGAATAYLANQKGRDPLLWSMGILTMSIFGMPFAVMGLGLLYFLPSVDEEEDIPEKHEFDEISQSPPPGLSATEISGAEWFFYDDGRQRQGPFSFDGLRDAWKDGRISVGSYVWAEGFDAWKKIGDVPQLVDALEGASAKTDEE